MLFLHKDEVLEIHSRLLEQFGGLAGIRDEGLLDSALLAAASRQHYEGADLAACRGCVRRAAMARPADTAWHTAEELRWNPSPS